ncbi:MAG: hypothetical protein ABII00_02045 [Elusimicrobiota bacterium]
MGTPERRAEQNAPPSFPTRPIAIAVLLLLPGLAARGGSLRVTAYDAEGRLMDAGALLRHIAPAARKETGVPPEESGLYLTDLEGREAPGRPWWVAGSTTPAWAWEGAERVRVSMPWPVAEDGFSTVSLDGESQGYGEGQSILLNEQIALCAYRHMQESLKERTTRWEPRYEPGPQTRGLADRAKNAVAEARAARARREQARLFDKALTEISTAWQHILFEHGRQVLRDPEHGPRLRRGLTLDETVVDRIKEYDWIAKKVADAGADWVRLPFRSNPEDFSYARRNSFNLYDKLVEALVRRKVRVMGSVLDSMLWPGDVTPDLYRERTSNLVRHFKDRIRSWEIASEPNGTWLGGAGGPLSDETVLLSIQRAAVEVKRIDASLETVATLHWWEGTAPDARHGLLSWLRWSTPRGFGRGIDVVALSVYPHRHPLGLAFGPVFRELHRLFPEKRLMLGGWSFGDDAKKESPGYWWLKPGTLPRDMQDARKDLVVLFAGSAAAIPASVGGGFFWPTLQQMLRPGRKTTSLYRTYKRTLKRLR